MNKLKKIILVGSGVTIFVGIILFITNIKNSNPIIKLTESDRPKEQTILSHDASNQKIFKQVEILKEARELEKQGAYKEAIAKYVAAMNPSLLSYDYDAGTAHGGILGIRQKEGRLEEALKELQWFLSRNPTKYEDKRLELNALIKSKSEKSDQPINEYLQYLNEKYNKNMPIRYLSYGAYVVNEIIWLYDYIGNTEFGIKFLDKMLTYPNLDEKRKAVYLKIREIFEDDKKEGWKGCRDAKAGEVCMGRATKALIQSDYFPW